MLIKSLSIMYFSVCVLFKKKILRAISKSRGNDWCTLHTDNYKRVIDCYKMDVFSPKQESFFSFCGFLFEQGRFVLNFSQYHMLTTFLLLWYFGVKRGNALCVDLALRVGSKTIS